MLKLTFFFRSFCLFMLLMCQLSLADAADAADAGSGSASASASADPAPADPASADYTVHDDETITIQYPDGRTETVTPEAFVKKMDQLTSELPSSDEKSANNLTKDMVLNKVVEKIAQNYTVQADGEISVSSNETTSVPKILSLGRVTEEISSSTRPARLQLLMRKMITEKVRLALPAEQANAIIRAAEYSATSDANIGLTVDEANKRFTAGETFNDFIDSTNTAAGASLTAIKAEPPKLQAIEQTARGQAELGLNQDLQSVALLKSKITRLTTIGLAELPKYFKELITSYQLEFPGGISDSGVNRPFIQLSLQTLGSILGGGGALGEIYDTCPAPAVSTVGAGSTGATDRLSDPKRFEKEATHNCRVLPRMFYWFNWGLIGILSLILSYTGLIATYDTLSEGVLFGQRGTPFFTLFRSFIGVTSVMPLPSGYSLLQMLVMWITLQGIHLGNLSWVMVKYLYYANANWIAPTLIEEKFSDAAIKSHFVGPVISTQLTTNLMGLARNILIAEVCSIASVNSLAGVDSGDEGVGKATFYTLPTGKLREDSATLLSYPKPAVAGKLTESLLSDVKSCGSITLDDMSKVSFTSFASLTGSTVNKQDQGLGTTKVPVLFYTQILKLLQSSIYPYANQIYDNLGTPGQPSTKPTSEDIDKNLSQIVYSVGQYWTSYILTQKQQISDDTDSAKISKIIATTKMNPHIYLPGTDWVMFGALYNDLLDMMALSYQVDPNKDKDTVTASDAALVPWLPALGGVIAPASGETYSTSIYGKMKQLATNYAKAAYTNPNTSDRTQAPVSLAGGAALYKTILESANSLLTQSTHSGASLYNDARSAPYNTGSYNNLASVMDVAISDQWERANGLTHALLCSNVPMSSLFASGTALKSFAYPCGALLQYPLPIAYLFSGFSRGPFKTVDYLNYNWLNPDYNPSGDTVFATWQKRINQDYQVYVYQLITSWLYAFGSYSSSDYAANSLLADNTAWLTNGTVGLRFEDPAENVFTHKNPFKMMQHFGLAVLFSTVNFYRSVAQDVMMASINDGAKFAVAQTLANKLGGDFKIVATVITYVSWVLKPIPIFGQFGWLLASIIQTITRMVRAYFVVMGSLQPLFFAMDNFLRMQYIPFAVAASVPPMVLGLTLSVWIPVLPFLAYILSVLGWLFTVLESVVAAPVIALGVTHPRGHDFLGRSEQAFILLLSLFIKPVGIVIGFIFAMLMVFVGFFIFHQMVDGFFVGLLKSFLVNAPQSSGFEGYFPFVIALFIYVYAASTYVSLCFTLTYRLPNYLAKWIGLNEGLLSSMAIEEELMGEIESSMRDEGAQTMGDAAAASVNKSFGFSMVEPTAGGPKLSLGSYAESEEGKKSMAARDANKQSSGSGSTSK
jgi:conjugal transfer/type IV secretion protein DotA/TraY